MRWYVGACGGGKDSPHRGTDIDEGEGEAEGVRGEEGLGRRGRIELTCRGEMGGD